jgi:hypothetical protein
MKIRTLIFSTVVAGFFIVPTSYAATTSNCGIFKDVSSTHPNCQAIQYAYERGIFKGYNLSSYTDGSADFKPSQSIIRAEVLKVVLSAFVNQDFTNTNINGSAFPFTDIKSWPNQWWMAYLEEAINRQMIEGYNDGTFRPQNNVTRAEFLKIFLAASPKAEEVNSLTINNYDSLWADTPPTAWYAKYMIYANTHGLFAQFSYCTSGSICPNKDISRAEVAQMIYNYHNYLSVEVGFPLNSQTCYKEGESLGALIPENSDHVCCPGLTPYIEPGMLGTMGVCVAQ